MFSLQFSLSSLLTPLSISGQLNKCHSSKHITFYGLCQIRCLSFLKHFRLRHLKLLSKITNYFLQTKTIFLSRTVHFPKTLIQIWQAFRGLKKTRKRERLNSSILEKSKLAYHWLRWLMGLKALIRLCSQHYYQVVRSSNLLVISDHLLISAENPPLMSLSSLATLASPVRPWRDKYH